MRKWRVTVRETTEREMEVEAQTAEEALEEAEAEVESERLPAWTYRLDVEGVAAEPLPPEEAEG